MIAPSTPHILWKHGVFEKIYLLSILPPLRTSFASLSPPAEESSTTDRKRGTSSVDQEYPGLIVNKKKPKHLFGEKELVHFTNTLWTVDDAQFTHPRNKVQIPFAIAVFCWTGARIGAFFPEKENKHKGGLRYRVSLSGRIRGEIR